MSDHVVLDLSPTTLLLLSTILPPSMLALPFILSFLSSLIVPSRWRSLLHEPSDGLSAIELATVETGTSDQTKGSRDTKIWLLSVGGSAQVVLYSVMFVFGAVRRERMWGLQALNLGSWVLVTLIPVLKTPITAPYTLLNYYTTQLVLIGFRSIHRLIHERASVAPWLPEVFNACILIILISTCLSFRITPHLIEEAEPTPNEVTENSEVDDGIDEITKPSPETSVTLIEWLVFSWVRPIIRQGEQTKLGYRDVWKLPSTMSSIGVRRSAANLNSQKIIPRIFYNNSLDLILSLSLGFLSTFLSYCGPYLLRKILQSLEYREDPIERTNLRKSAFIFTALSFLAQIARAEVDLQQLWHERRMILRTRSELMSRIYEKSLKRRDTSGVVSPEDVASSTSGKKKKGAKGGGSDAAKSSASLGKIVSLMSMDANKVANQLMTLSSFASAPFELVVATIFLYQILGWSMVAMVIILLTLPLNQILVKRRILIQKNVLSSRDKRMEVLNEFVTAIRYIKYGATESQWLGRVFKARETELSWLYKTRINNLLINCMWNLTPDLVMLVAFAFYTKLMHQQLDVATAFTALALFGLVRSPLTMLPGAMNQILQTLVSVRRIEAYLEEPEVEGWVSALDKGPVSQWTESKPIRLTEGHFKYQDKTTKSSTSSAAQASAAKSKIIPPPAMSTTAIEISVDPENEPEEEQYKPFELIDIDISFPISKLSLIAGPTGSGKSSIFLALLGEMDRLEGTIELEKGGAIDPRTGLYEGVAYAAQLPWLRHQTIKENICFGAKWEKERYDKVVEACALQPDLEMFDAGDETEIGERGISLSGGQRARVALARALYSRAKTLLLDDPLSAVDAHTAKHLFKALKGPLTRDRTVILITHHLSLCLPGADYLIRLSSGRIELQGSVQDLDLSDIAVEAMEESEKDAVKAQDEERAVDGPEAEVPTTKAAIIEASNATTPVDPKKLDPKSGKLIETEARATGRVKTAVYTLYLKAAGYETWAMVTVLILAGRLARLLDRYWLKVWGESYENHSSSSSMIAALFLPRPSSSAAMTTFLGGPVAETSSILPHLPSASDSVTPYLIGYGLIALLNLLLLIFGYLVTFSGSFKAARKLFVETTTRVSRATFRYFDTTPTGRILNRFSSDIQTIDTSISEQVRVCMTHAFSFVVNVGVIIFVSPKFVPPAVLIIYVYVRLSLSYVKCSRDLRRLESNARSPIFSNFGETLAGIVTVRAFGAERRFLDELFSKSVDKMLAVSYASAMINRYLLWRFDVLGAIAVAITTILSLIGGASPGLAALAITSAQSLVQSVYWLCRFVSALEVDLNAVERVTELLEIPEEPPMIVEGKRPPAYWPSDTGGIVVENLVMSYAPSLPPVIKNVSFECPPRSKIAVVGRTGSGKSTLALSLLRFKDPESGKIIIDGIDISTIGLQDLRSRITLISQEATLFSGTIRSNLDPFDQHTDQECLDALARVRMISSPVSGSNRGSREASRAPSPTPGSHSVSGPVARILADENGRSSDASSIASGSSTTRVDSKHGRQSVTLSTPVSVAAGNFSAGERQLLALARAFLARSKIIIADEPSGSIDFETDQYIQRMIKEEFADSLVLTIAHRLSTVIGYDKILVLDHGELAEFDTPKNLMSKQGGLFREMCEQSADWDELKAAVEL